MALIPRKALDKKLAPAAKDSVVNHTRKYFSDLITQSKLLAADSKSVERRHVDRAVQLLEQSKRGHSSAKNFAVLLSGALIGPVFQNVPAEWSNGNSGMVM